MTNVLYALLGGALVVFGILAAAVADRVRGIKAGRRAEDSRAQRASERPIAPREAEPAERVKPQVPRAQVPRSEVRMREMADDVIAALVASGYKKAVAAEAAWGCGAAERTTLEGWTMAALRRAGKGAPS